ncbi:MAG: hypothetical protein OXG15_02995 [Gammaproteobacteria bacterium]|nr:hypothetical protein [Gammaproteobacteria bacterium]
MNFQIFGPYPVPVGNDHPGFIDDSDIRAFWSGTPELDELSSTCGVYLFGVKGQEGRRKELSRDRIWYVGKAEKLNFRGECFNGRNRNSYNKVLNAIYKNKGEAVMFFIVRCDQDGSFSESATEGTYDGLRFLEKMFIQFALQSNAELLNVVGLRNYKTTFIEGLLNDSKAGRRRRDVKHLWGSLGITGKPIAINVDSKKSNNYRVLGPYEVPIKSWQLPKQLDYPRFGELFENISDREQFDIANSSGVYIILSQYRNSVKPVFVGNLNGWESSHRQAVNTTQYFEGFRIDERRLSKSVRSVRGNWTIYFLPRVKPNGNPAKPNRDSEDFLLSLVLDYAKAKNHNVRSSDSSSGFLSNLYLEGFINANQGESRRNTVRSLREFLF